MKIRISCIIPYYNVDRELILDCVNSILRQDFEDYEILIVDDGSDAAHAAVLDEIGRLDSRIRIFHRGNRGVSAARNAAMEYAEGEYISFVDADDVVVPYYFSEAFRIAEGHGAEYVVGGAVATHTRQLQVTRVPSPTVTECDAGEFRSSFLNVTERMQENGYFGRGPVARLMKAELVKQVPFPEDVKIGEDSLWNMDVLLKCSKVYKVYQIWYIYWQHPESACHRYDENIIPVIERHLEELAARTDFDREDEAVMYFLRMYEFLRQQVFGCYLGRKECPLPVFRRARMFRALGRREPWNLYRGHVVPKHCGRRTRGKLFLLHSGLLYWFWLLRSRVRREPSAKSLR